MEIGIWNSKRKEERRMKTLLTSSVHKIFVREEKCTPQWFGRRLNFDSSTPSRGMICNSLYRNITRAMHTISQHHLYGWSNLDAQFFSGIKIALASASKVWLDRITFCFAVSYTPAIHRNLLQDGWIPARNAAYLANPVLLHHFQTKIQCSSALVSYQNLHFLFYLLFSCLSFVVYILLFVCYFASNGFNSKFNWYPASQ